MEPKLALCNFMPDMGKLRRFARDQGFSGIDWSFDNGKLPETPANESEWIRDLSELQPLEIRYHCPFHRMDMGHDDPEEARRAYRLFHRIILLVSRARGRYLTVHVGLGLDSTESLSWERTIDNLTRLVHFGATHRVTVCLENLAWGWTSKPNLFEKLVRRSGAAVTLDLGHAFSCESVRSGQFTVEDFVTPHPDRVLNAHIYHRESSRSGHLPPESLEDIEDRLDLLQGIGCDWWVIEMREINRLMATKRVIDRYLRQEPLASKEGSRRVGRNSRELSLP